MHDEFPLPPRPADEAERLQALRRHALLDSEAEAGFDLLAETAALLCGASHAFVSLVDEQRVWAKAAFGAPRGETPRDQDYCAWAILEREGLHIPDLSQDPRTAALPLTRDGPRYRMYGAANLVDAEGLCLGMLCVLDSAPRTLTAAQRRLLAGLARQVVALMELRLRERELAQALEQMGRLAREDTLTGLPNRRSLLQELRREVQVAKRYGTPLSLLMLDLDFFKQVNDRYGHPMGDAVLRGVGAQLREVDIAGRLGGEEFCVLLPGTEAAGAAVLAEQLRRRIAAARFEDGGRQCTVTASLGLAAFAAGQHANAEALLRAADQALYRAKQGGRDRVVTA